MKDASAEFPKRCLDHITRTTRHLDIEVASIERSGPSFRYPKSINEGLRRFASKDLVLTMNDDVFVDEGWLDALLAASARHPNVGIWGSLLRYPDGRMQHAGGWLETRPLAYLARSTLRGHPFDALRYMREEPKHVILAAGHHLKLSSKNRLDFVTGACQMITRACLDKVGEYDEGYNFGFEDVDHSLRALEAGFELGLATRSTGIHVDHHTNMPGSRWTESRAHFDKVWSRPRVERAILGRTGVYDDVGS
jgi:GT2 family glycosyltransferase